MNYVDRFLNLNCAPDILNIVPKQKKFCKEISEAMSVLERIKKIVRADKEADWCLIDFCAGNALGSLLAVFMLPLRHAIAFDKKKRGGSYGLAKRFCYIEADILGSHFEDRFQNDSKHLASSCENPRFIFLGIHPCGNLSERIIELYNESAIIRKSHLILMPCCVGNMSKADMFLQKKMGSYFAWVYYLKTLVSGTAKIYEDKYCLSPRNLIIQGESE